MFKRLLSRKYKGNKRGNTLVVTVATILGLTILATSAFNISFNNQIQVENVLDNNKKTQAQAKLADAVELFCQKMKEDNTQVKNHAALIYYAYDVLTLQKVDSDGTWYRLYIESEGKYLYVDILFEASGDSGDEGMNDTLFSEEAKISELYSIDNMSSMYLSEIGYMPIRNYPYDQISTIPSDVNTVNEIMNYTDKTGALIVDSLDFVYCQNDQGGSYLQKDGTYSSNLANAVVAYSTGQLGGNQYYTSNDTLFSKNMYYKQYNYADTMRVAIYVELLKILDDDPSLDEIDVFAQLYEGAFLESNKFGAIVKSSFSYKYNSEEYPTPTTIKYVDKHIISYDAEYKLNGVSKANSDNITLDSTTFANYLGAYYDLEISYTSFVSVKDFINMIWFDDTSKYDYSVYSKENRQSAKAKLQESNTLNNIAKKMGVTDELTQALSKKHGILAVRNITINEWGGATANASTFQYNENKNCWQVDVTYRGTYEYGFKVFNIEYWAKEWNMNETVTVYLNASNLYYGIKDTHPRPQLDPNEVIDLTPAILPENKTGEVITCKYLYLLADYLDRFVSKPGYTVNGRTMDQIVQSSNPGATITGYAGRYVNALGGNNGIMKLDSVQIYVYFQKTDGSLDKMQVNLPTIYVAAVSRNPQLSTDGLTPVLAHEGNIAPIIAISYFDRNYNDANGNQYGTEISSTDGEVYSKYSCDSGTNPSNDKLANVESNTYFKSRFEGDFTTPTTSDWQKQYYERFNEGFDPYKENFGYYSNSDTIHVKNGASLYIDGDLILEDNAQLILEDGCTLFINGDLIVNYEYVGGKSNIKNKGVNIIGEGANIIVDGNIEYRGLKAEERLFMGSGYAQLNAVTLCDGGGTVHSSADEYRSKLEGIFIVNGNVNFYSDSVSRDIIGIKYNAKLYSDPLMAATWYVDGKIDLKGFWTPCLYDLCRPNFIFAKVIVQPEIVLADVWKYLEGAFKDIFTGGNIDLNEYCHKMGYLFIICEDAINFSQFNFASVNVYTPYNVTSEGIEENKDVEADITKHIDKDKMGLYTENDIDNWGLPPILRQAMFNAFVGGDMSTTTENPADNSDFTLVYDPSQDNVVEA